MMGTFTYPIEVISADGSTSETVDATVDTGSTFTCLPASLLHELGIVPYRRIQSELADGSVTEDDMGIVHVRVEGIETPTLAIFADEGAPALLGAYTLEGALLVVDPVRQRLAPTHALRYGNQGSPAVTVIPDYIEQRIRRPIPADSCVVPGSTPVVAFGNARTATVATLGLNPSRVEFLDRYGRELVGVDRRLATHQSLGLSDLSDAPSSVVEQVLRDCIEYFSRNPYWQWFGHLEQVLNDIGASYSDGSACHLDLVQWATDPTWSELPRGLQGKLTDDDAVFFEQQLTNENINLLLVNGKSVIDQLRRKHEAVLKEVNGVQNHNSRFVVGKVFDRVCVVGWSTNLQSSFGVTTEWKTAIADRASQLVSDLGCNI